jgi:ribosome-binding protein aMBF1 (putative translation factor)
MTKLTVDTQVLKKLRQAHPTPASSAGRLLDKYVGVLTELVNEALQQERSGFMRTKGIYSINVSKLHRKPHTIAQMAGR